MIEQLFEKYIAWTENDIHYGTLHHDLLKRGYLSLWFISCRNSIGAYVELHEIEESVKTLAE